MVPSASLNIKSRVDYSKVLISSQSVGVDQLCLQPLMYAQGEDLTGAAVDLARGKATQVLSRSDRHGLFALSLGRLPLWDPFSSDVWSYATCYVLFLSAAVISCLCPA